MVLSTRTKVMLTTMEGVMATKTIMLTTTTFMMMKIMILVVTNCDHDADDDDDHGDADSDARATLSNEGEGRGDGNTKITCIFACIAKTLFGRDLVVCAFIHWEANFIDDAAARFCDCQWTSFRCILMDCERWSLGCSGRSQKANSSRNCFSDEARLSCLEVMPVDTN